MCCPDFIAIIPVEVYLVCCTSSVYNKLTNYTEKIQLRYQTRQFFGSRNRIIGSLELILVSWIKSLFFLSTISATRTENFVFHINRTFSLRVVTRFGPFVNLEWHRDTIFQSNDPIAAKIERWEQPSGGTSAKSRKIINDASSSRGEKVRGS